MLEDLNFNPQHPDEKSCICISVYHGILALEDRDEKVLGSL